MRFRRGHDLLVASPCFVVEHFAITKPLTLTAAPGRTSAQVLVAVEGSAVVEWEGGQPVSFNRGEAVVIPASIAANRAAPAMGSGVSPDARAR